MDLTIDWRLSDRISSFKNGDQYESDSEDEKSDKKFSIEKSGTTRSLVRDATEKII